MVVVQIDLDSALPNFGYYMDSRRLSEDGTDAASTSTNKLKALDPLICA